MTGLKASFDELDDGRQNGDEDDCQDDKGKVLLYHRQIAKEVTPKSEQSHPGYPTDYIVGDKLAVGHGANTSHEGGKGANDGDEASDDDGLSTIFFIKGVGAVKVLFFQESDIAAERARTDAGANPIVHRIAQDGGNA